MSVSPWRRQANRAAFGCRFSNGVRQRTLVLGFSERFRRRTAAGSMAPDRPQGKVRISYGTSSRPPQQLDACNPTFLSSDGTAAFLHLPPAYWPTLVGANLKVGLVSPQALAGEIRSSRAFASHVVRRVCNEAAAYLGLTRGRPPVRTESRATHTCVEVLAAPPRARGPVRCPYGIWAERTGSFHAAQQITIRRLEIQEREDDTPFR